MASGAATTILLSLALCHVVIREGGWFPQVSATTCSNTTDFSCPVTLYSTGTCSADGNCTCATGSSPEAFGCRRDAEVPYIRLQDEDALPYGSDGANFTLICEPDNLMATYTWRLNGTVLAGVVSYLFVNESIADSPYGYTCQYSEPTQTSSESDVFYINIVSLSDVNVSDPAVATQIQGIPTSIVNETILDISCTPTMKINRTVEWFHSFESPTIDGNMLTTEVITLFDRTSVSCRVNYTADDVTKTVEATSLIPSLAANIPGVHIAEGDRFILTLSNLQLTCAFDESDFVTNGISITWEWFLNGTIDNSLTTQSISVASVDASRDQGEWSCAAQWGDREKRESANVTVYVDFPYTVSMTTFPAIAIMNGYLEISCNVDSPLDLNFTYQWFHGMTPLGRSLDHTLYFNDVMNETVAGTYFCSANIDETGKDSTNEIVISDVVLFSESTPPTLTSNNTGDVFTFGEAYQLICTVDQNYSTPGFRISFLANGIPIATQEYDNILITEQSDDRIFTCQTTFNSLVSNESNAILVSFSGIYHVQVEDTNNNLITSVDAVVNTVINLCCDINVIGEVMGQVNATWYNVNGTSVGTGKTLGLNVMEEADVTYFCVADLGNQTRRSSNNVTVFAHVLSAPVLSIVGRNATEDLDFQEAHQLSCDADNITLLFDILYTFFQDGNEVITNSPSNVYNVTNDIYDRNYSCQLVYLTASSPLSSNVTVSFAVFNVSEVHDTDGNAITFVYAIVNVSTIRLVSFVTFLPGVSGQANITWFEDDVMEIGTDSTVVLNPSQEGTSVYFFEARLASHTMRSSNIVTLTSHVLPEPVLSMVNKNTSYNLDFQQTHQLHCDAGNLTSLFDIRYTFFKDGVEDVTNTSYDTYNITNDIYNRDYSCQSLYVTASSPISDNVTASFAVFDTVEIHDTKCILKTFMNAVVDTSVTLVSFVTLLPTVPGQASITWYDDALTVVGSDSILVVNITEDRNLTFFFEAHLGSHTMRSSDNLTIITYVLSEPVLSMVNGNTSDNLDFQQTHQLHCDAGEVTSLFDIRYTFLKDGVEVVTNSSYDTYNITNDIYNRDYSCQSLYLTASSPISDNVTASFAVFDTVEIHDTKCILKTFMNAVVDTSVTLVSFVTLLPTVPGQVSITWYDDALTVVGSDSILVVNITEDRNLTFFFEANLGSHTMRSSDNLTIITYVLTAPVLTMVDSNTSQHLDFQQIYQLHCQSINITLLFDIRHTFLQDGIEVVTNSSSDTYTITNDVYDRNYTCQSLYLTASSPISSHVTVSFEVFETLEIHDMNGDVASSVPGIVNASVSLVSSVSLLTDVPGQASITWYDETSSQVGTDSTLVVNVTEERNFTFFFQAELGSHSMRSPDNVTVIAYVLEAPVLSMIDNVTGDSLDFSKTYYLHCDVGPILSTFALEYEYSEDGAAVHTGNNDTYAIVNDVFDRQYACHASYQTVTSHLSNSVNTSFEVFDALDISESLRCHVRSEINPMFEATLTCNVSLLPTVPENITYTWYDVNNTDIGSASTYSIFVTGDLNTTVTCQAQVGNHVKSFTSTYEVYNITIPCSASCFHLSFTLLVLAFVVTFYLCVN